MGTLRKESFHDKNNVKAVKYKNMENCKKKNYIDALWVEKHDVYLLLFCKLRIKRKKKDHSVGVQ